MRKFKQTFNLIILTLFLMLTAATVNQTLAQSAGNSASPTRTTQNASDDLKDCSQMLDQSLEETKAAKNLIVALAAENESRKNLAAIQKGIIQQQEKLIEILSKKSKRKISFFFGLVKITY